MNIQDIKKVIPVLLRNKVVPFLWGAQGLGKTQTMKQIAKENDLGFVHLHLATQEVGDIVGLLFHGENGTVKHARPTWFPTEGKGVVFLDELNRAHPDVLQAMFSFITEGTIHTHKLPEGWSIVAAGNYQSNDFNVTDTSDKAWLSRFCHLDFTPTREEFISYAESVNGDTIANFISTHPELLEVVPKDKPVLSNVQPDRRSWLDMINRLENEDTIENNRYEVYAGIVGATAAASFITFKTKQESRLSGKDILGKYKTVKETVLKLSSTDETRFDLLSSAVDEIFLIVEKKKSLSDREMNNFKEFLLDIPLELGLKVFNKMHSTSWSQKNLILNNKDFVTVFEKTKLEHKKAS